jgi:hypothetical protein
VESFHAHEETEFFDIEQFRRRKDFWEKITTYQHYWNFGRPNSYKADRTPWEILREAEPRAPASLLLLPPVDLEKLFKNQVDHHLPDHPEPTAAMGWTRYIVIHPGCW